MVSIMESADGKYWKTGANDVTVYCLSSDAKPTEKMRNGYKCIEMDTKKVFLFSESDATWYEFT